MESSINVRRVSLPHITHLEMWDCMLKDATLWDCMYCPGFAERLLEAVHLVLQGQAISQSTGIIETGHLSFDSIFLSGGGISGSMADAMLQALPVPVIVAEYPVFGGTPGGTRLLERSGLSGIVVDVGQSQIKISCENMSKTFKRDFGVLPVSLDEMESAKPVYREALRAFIADSIRSFGIAKRPKGIVMALPCTLDSRGFPGSCSYPGLREDLSIVRDVCERAGIVNTTVLALNDAELAAYSACCDTRLSGFKTTLVLTIGFGVGCAVLESES
jgi:hypothetical protein